LARASFQELRQFLPRRPAESVVAALSMSVLAEAEHARSEQLDSLTRRLAEGVRILQINMLDHVIVGQSFDRRPGYLSFKEAGMI
jgi:DNA repair protein RadC